MIKLWQRHLASFENLATAGLFLIYFIFSNIDTIWQIIKCVNLERFQQRLNSDDINLKRSRRSKLRRLANIVFHDAH